MKDIVFHLNFLKINIYQVIKKMHKATSKIQKKKKTMYIWIQLNHIAMSVLTGRASIFGMDSWLRIQVLFFFFSIKLLVFRFSSLYRKGHKFRSKIIVTSRA